MSGLYKKPTGFVDLTSQTSHALSAIAGRLKTSDMAGLLANGSSRSAGSAAAQGRHQDGRAHFCGENDMFFSYLGIY